MEKSRTLALVCHATSPVFPQAGKIIAPARKDYCKTTYFRQNPKIIIPFFFICFHSLPAFQVFQCSRRGRFSHISRTPHTVRHCPQHNSLYKWKLPLVDTLSHTPRTQRKLNFATLFDIIRTTILFIVTSYTIFTKARLITLFIPFNYHYFFISTMTRSQNNSFYK